MKWNTLFLIFFSKIFELIVRIRHYGYDKGLFSSFHSGIITVSVGNYVVGGSGKTPIVAFLASLLTPECKVAIATRGYLGAAEKRKYPLFAKDEKGEVRSWREVGDEPYWLAKTLEGVGVFVGRRRSLSAQVAKERGYELLLLDDGMQHRKLARNIEIVVVEGRDPFGGNHFLPRGRLREDPKRIAHADLIFINGMIRIEDRNKLKSLTLAPLVQGEMRIRRVVDRKGKEKKIQGKKVALFCALGSPLRFVETVSLFGSEVVATYFLPDHQPFEIKKLEHFAEQAKKAGAELLCCTEKDHVKLIEDHALNDHIAIIEAEFVIQENEESALQLITKIKSLAKEKR